MREFWSKLVERLTVFSLNLIDQHPGKVIGSALGFGIGLFVVVLGFWRSLVICLFVGAGFYLGKRRDERRDFGELLQSLFGNRK
ncbi:MAG TPA: DUF2273 domain-containing protein [Verrucomicrobiae bacterium]|nr:DUF2273 domain-containing protein [Verrucomicrobiae bacterium]